MTANGSGVLWGASHSKQDSLTQDELVSLRLFQLNWALIFLVLVSLCLGLLLTSFRVEWSSYLAMLGMAGLYGIIGHLNERSAARNAKIYATLITLAQFISMLVLLISSRLRRGCSEFAHAGKKSAGARPYAWIRFQGLPRPRERPTAAALGFHANIRFHPSAASYPDVYPAAVRSSPTCSRVRVWLRHRADCDNHHLHAGAGDWRLSRGQESCRPTIPISNQSSTTGP